MNNQFDDQDQPRKSFSDKKDFVKKEFSGNRDFSDRPRREGSEGDRDSRPRREFSEADRPRRDFGDRDSRPRREFAGRDDRPKRDFGDKKDFSDRPRREFGDKKDFSDRPKRDFADRSDRPRRDFGDKKDFGAKGDFGDKKFAGGFRQQKSFTQEITDLDQEIISLILRRSRAMQRMTKGEQIKSSDEKNLRIAWETAVSAYSHEPRFTKELFALLQDLASADDKQNSFNLAPNYNKVDFTMPALLDSDTARMYLALATAAGANSKILNMELADPTMDFIKLFNQLGGELWWEEHEILSRGGLGIKNNLDKVLFVGQDEFNFALALSFNLFCNSKFKIIGDGKLRSIKLGALKKAFTALGARVTGAANNIDGLPIRVEFSGILPEAYTFPAELEYYYTLAILLSAPLWQKNGSIKFNLSNLDYGKKLLNRLLPVFNTCQIKYEQSEQVLTVFCAKPQLPELLDIEIKSDFAAYCLAIPLFTGGEIRMPAKWAKNEFTFQVEQLFASQGIDLQYADNLLTSKRKDNYTKQVVSIGDYDSDLQPLALALSLLPVVTGKTTNLQLGTVHDPNFVADFLAQLGLICDELGQVEHMDKSKLALYCPTAQWALALGLIAFAQPNLKLANPNVMNELSPRFWLWYNALPKPDFNAPLRKKKEFEDSNNDDEQRRIPKRRILTDGPADNPEPVDPDLIPYSEYDE